MPLCPDSDDARKSPAFIMKLFLFLIVRKVIVHYSQQRYRGAEMKKKHIRRDVASEINKTPGFTLAE